MVAKAPELKSIPSTAPAQPLPEFQPNVPAPKLEVRTGSLQSTATGRAAEIAKSVEMGGFGDPRGASPSESTRSSPIALGKVGAFDLAGGTGRENGTPRGSGGVHTGGFGNSSIVPSSNAFNGHTKAAVEAAFTPVEILSKPKPAYSAEARSLKLEGQVSIQVVFQATGSVRVLRVLHGLGHGLDEAAEQAALQVHFRPATRGGVPVDSDATIHITFELT